jgi:F420-dependent oxidoreductase-like protein
MPEFRVSAWLDLSWPMDQIIAAGKEAEAAGYDGLWVADHFMGNTGTDERSDDGVHECFSVLAGLSTVVPRVRLGSMVAGITYRNPGVLAAMASTIDHLSDGRLVLGVGAGWQLNEHAAYGIELGPIRERIDRFEEGLAALRGLLTEQRTTVEGKYFQILDAPNEPKPVQPRMPILIGASGEKRMLGIVAETADEWNTWSTPELFAQKSAVLNEHCERVGRDPKSIQRSTQAIVQIGDTDEPSRFPFKIGGSIDQLVDTIGQWREAGLDEWIVPSFGPADKGRELLNQVISDVVPQLS